MRKFRVLGAEDRSKVLQKIKEHLARRKEVLFAYIHGSFLEGGSFRDLDIALFLDESKMAGSFLDYELELEQELEAALVSQGLFLPVDVRVLNRASLSFQYSVLKRGDTPVGGGGGGKGGV